MTLRNKFVFVLVLVLVATLVGCDDLCQSDHRDFDGDGTCNAQDLDIDGDGIPEMCLNFEGCKPCGFKGKYGVDCVDNCPWDYNPEQDDFDRDGVGNDCDPSPY